MHSFIHVKPPATLSTLTSKPEATVTRALRLPAWAVPAVVLLGFCALFLILLGNRLLPAPQVDVAPVLSTPAVESKPSAQEIQSPGSGTILFQAGGWIEPAPLPIKATALIDGVVETVHVLPGDDVRQGQPLATLISDDARLAHSAARQRHHTLEAALQAHLSAIAAAGKKVAGLTAEVAAAKARQAEARDKARRMARMPKGTVPEADVISAQLNLDRESAQTEAATAAVEQMRAEIDRLHAETAVKRGEIAAAAVELEQAALALSRTEITAPSDGRILRLPAAPGQKKMLASDDPDSATIAILYRPRELQVRVDVPLADAAGLHVGQAARIHCSLLPDTVFQGKLTHITGEADLQRNTLQAKVRIIDPADQLRPEMLCRVEFMETRNPSSPARTALTLATWIPQNSLTTDAVWVCDPESKRVGKRSVTASGETRDGYVRISDGLRPGEWIVLSPRDLRDGQRVRPNLTQP